MTRDIVLARVADLAARLALDAARLSRDGGLPGEGLRVLNSHVAGLGALLRDAGRQNAPQGPSGAGVGP